MSSFQVLQETAIIPLQRTMDSRIFSPSKNHESMLRTGQATSPKYRPDIDGLRAVAMLSVLFYHFQVGPFTGGFVGVDVFFVISGYLITSLIHSETASGAFSIARFYERRVRRILPALFLMMLATTILAGSLLFPQDLMNYARSLIATALFGSNFFFWSTVDYFDIIAERKPLLHTWSLAIEEQFYLLYPALLWFLRDAMQPKLFQVVSAIFLVSLAANIWAIRFAPISDFYLLPFRAWELMLGAMLALSPLKSSARICTVLAWLGVALLLFSIFALSINTPFPGEYALLPCIGAAFLIYAGPQTIVGRALSLRPVVFIGLISYSLYLWHWPVLIFARYVVLRDLLFWEKLALILLSGLVATLSWVYVEKPFRTLGKIPRGYLLPLAGTGIAIFVIASAIGEFSRGLPQRFDLAFRSLVAATVRGPDPCQTPHIVGPHRFCRIGAQGTTPATFVIWGDSHAGAILPAVMDIVQREALSGYATGLGNCAPLAGVTMLTGATGKACRDYNDEAARLATEKSIRTVVLAAKWAAYAEGTHFSIDDGGPSFLLRDDASSKSDRRQNVDVFSRGLERTVAALAHAGKNVMIVASVPEMKVSVPHALARKYRFNLNIDIRLELAEYLQRQLHVFSALEDMQRRYGAKIIYPHQVLCANGYCDTMRDGIVLYSDSNHLTVFGAKLLRPLFEEFSQVAPTQ
jgi:peptidoglycan/LPS O-acetylase OafA/YrhL